MREYSEGLRTASREFIYSTSAEVELVDVTEDVERAVAESGVKSGICLVSVPHSTAAVIASEHEEGLLADIVRAIRELFPKDRAYLHNRIDDNAHAHLAAALIGQSRSLPVVEGRLARGTWQNIFLVELDGPRTSRRLLVTVVGCGDEARHGRGSGQLDAGQGPQEAQGPGPRRQLDQP